MGGRKVIPSTNVTGSEYMCFTFSPDGHKFACVSASHDIYVYQTNPTHVLRPLTGHTDWINYLLWSRDGSRLFSASYDQTILCWNSETGEPFGLPRLGHTGTIRSLSLSPDGSILASASSDCTVRFWDVAAGSPVGKDPQYLVRVEAVSFSPSGEFVVSAEVCARIYLWRVPWWDSINNQVITAFMCVLALVLSITPTGAGASDCSQRVLLYILHALHSHLPVKPPLGLLPSAEQVWAFDSSSHVRICHLGLTI